jgi:pre-60S factor REI1
MEGESSRSDFVAATIREQTPHDNEDGSAHSSSPSTDHEFDDYEFDESQCLFCNQTSSGLDENSAHMLKAHGLYVDPAHLLVDIGTLLAYFHFIISGRYECLYCGTQRNTREAVQQHMMAKGHCKYDITAEDSELREFYEFPSSDAKEELHQSLAAMRLSDDPHLPSQARLRKPRPSKRLDRHGPDVTASPLDQVLRTPSPTPQSHADAQSSSRAAEIPSHSQRELSTRAMKQEHTLNNQLAQLRAGDRRSLLHLPTSRQRAVLAAHHKQMEKARRTEQTSQGNLETAGNKFNCLGKIRLIRKPPHTGNISSLNR